MQWVWALGGVGCPLTTPSKGGPGYFAMGASINTKEEVSVFVLEEGKEKKKKIYYRLLFFASIIQLIIHFELNSTAQYNNGFCQDHQHYIIPFLTTSRRFSSPWVGY